MISSKVCILIFMERSHVISLLGFKDSNTAVLSYLV